MAALPAPPALLRSPLPPARWLAAAADELVTPMLLLEVDGRLVHANRAGREWLAAQRHYRLDEAGALVPVVARARSGWRRLLMQAAFPPAADAADASPPALPHLPGWRLRRLRPAGGVGATAGAAGTAAAPRLVLLRPLPEGE